MKELWELGVKLTKDELLEILKDCKEDPNGYSDREYDHIAADKALLDYINDPEVTKAFNDIYKWYA